MKETSGLNGLWSKEESRLPINVLELMAAEFAVKVHTKTRSHVSCPFENGQHTSLNIHQQVSGNKVTIAASKYQDSLGILSYQSHPPISRIPSRETKLDCGYIVSTISGFEQLEPLQTDPQTDQQSLGMLMIHLFADRLNAQLQTDINWKPDSSALVTDFFCTSGKRNAFPHFCLIGRCLAKSQKERAQVVLIAPAWQRQHWYPLLLSMLIDFHQVLP